MSGIAGLFMRTGEPADAHLVRAMVATTPRRAPDGFWIIQDGSFSGVRLRTITASEDESEDSPVRDPSTRAVLLFDGRLDNRDELISVLGLPSAARTAWPDAWIALKAWKAWGLETPRRLLGDFALVAWSPLDRTVFCACDVMGVRPLYYFLSDRMFVFGSEVRQLLSHPLISCEPDETMIGGLLAGELPRESDRTLFRGVHRLPHAHALIVRSGGHERTRYWQIDCARELKLRNDHEYAEALRDVFDKAVVARLRGRGAIGAYLSGGLDSSSVVTTANAYRQGMPLFAFSLVFPSDPDADERRYSQAVLRHATVTGVQIVPPPLGRDEVIAQVAARRELPDFPHDFAGNSARRAMATRGIRIALTGSGGDTGLTGSHFHCADLLRQGRLVQFWRRYRDVARQSATAWSAAHVIPSHLWPLLPRMVRRYLRPAARRLAARGVPRWIQPEFARRAGLTTEPPPRDVPGGQLARTDVADGFDSPWAHLALDSYQRGSAEWSIEDRHPFFDRRVVELVASLPDEQRWQNGQTRYVLRRAMDQRLPAEVRDRTDAGKGDFSHVYVPALEALGGIELFSEGMSIARNGWVEAVELRAMYRRMLVLREKRDLAYGDLAWRLWVAAALEMWCSGAFARSGRDHQWISEIGSMSAARSQPPFAAQGHIGAPC